MMHAPRPPPDGGAHLVDVMLGEQRIERGEHRVEHGDDVVGGAPRAVGGEGDNVREENEGAVARLDNEILGYALAQLDDDVARQHAVE